MTTLQAFERGAHRHSYEDGITEILTGMLLATGAAVTATRFAYAIPLVAVVLAVLLPRLRNRYAAPRAGYAELPVKARRLIGGIALYAVASAAVIVGLMAVTGDLTDRLAFYRWLPLFCGVLVAGGFVHAAGTSGLLRFKVYAAAATAGGLALTFAMPTPGRAAGYARLSLLLGFLAALLVASGAWVLVRFVRSNPAAPADAEGGGHGD